MEELTIIQNKIHEVRGHKVMLDFDLAELYGTETKVLKQAVKRNLQRFPPDFMFELTIRELAGLRSQIVTSNRGGTRYPPFAFTEHGIAMLSTVLNSEKAILVNIAIIRAFVLLRQFALNYSELAQKIIELEMKYDGKFEDFQTIIDLLLEEKVKQASWQNRQMIGFKK